MANIPARRRFLPLISTKARRDLDWQPVLTLEEAVGWSAEWFRRVEGREDAAQVTAEQIEAYMARIAPSSGRVAA